MMFLRRPSDEDIRRFLRAQQDSTFSYSEVGASRDGLPSGYAHDRYRVRLGSGAKAFERAREALDRWAMFQLGWVRLYDPSTPIAVGSDVAVLVRHFGFWSLNASRIVYLIDEDAAVRRHGFGYGTLTEHAEQGEERFLIKWDRGDDSVWYDVAAFSRPRDPFARLGRPLARLLQKRFARDSTAAMVNAVSRTADA